MVWYSLFLWSTSFYFKNITPFKNYPKDPLWNRKLPTSCVNIASEDYHLHAAIRHYNINTIQYIVGIFIMYYSTQSSCMCSPVDPVFNNRPPNSYYTCFFLDSIHKLQFFNITRRGQAYICPYYCVILHQLFSLKLLILIALCRFSVQSRQYRDRKSQRLCPTLLK